jgi:hypothetical protein
MGLSVRDSLTGAHSNRSLVCFYSGPQERLNFSVTLSIRNTDAQHPIIINPVTYYDEVSGNCEGPLP